MGKVLVVEDDPWSRRIVCDLLEMRGHEVLAAADIQHARTLLAAGPALVLLDIHVPGGGGAVLLAEIRGTEALRELPVIAFTASAMSFQTSTQEVKTQYELSSLKQPSIKSRLESLPKPMSSRRESMRISTFKRLIRPNPSHSNPFLVIPNS